MPVMARRRRQRSLKPSSLRVGEIIKTEVEMIDSNTTASHARSQMRRKGVGHLAVVEDGRVLGVVSERDLDERGAHRFPSGRIIRDFVTPGAVSVGSNTTLRQAVRLMLKNQIGALPVVDDGRFAGIVTATDVLSELGRSTERAPFPAWLPRPVKRQAGRTSAALVPAHIRVFGAKLSPAQREEIRKKLGAKLGKFAASIERVTVRLKDVNGPRGGIDQVCTIKVALIDLPSVVFESQHHSINAAVGAALAGVERAVRRRLQRRRMKPIKKQSTRVFASAR